MIIEKSENKSDCAIINPKVLLPFQAYLHHNVHQNHQNQLFDHDSKNNFFDTFVNSNRLLLAQVSYNSKQYLKKQFFDKNLTFISNKINTNLIKMYNDNSQINNTSNQFNQNLNSNCVQNISTSNECLAQKQLNIVKKMNLIDINGHSSQENDDSEDESDVLEISPCGRWSKRREEVEQHDIPNVDSSYLAIDGEEGLEVVWNEVRISERKYLQANEIRIDKVFNRLIQLNHNNIVKIHKYWVDMENPRLIFITEYMSSNTLKLFLKKTKTNVIKMTLTAWKRWCTQILCALRYLHSQKPSIIHGNLNCDTIFISHNGLIKIGAVAPDAIHQNVKTLGVHTMANFHLLAPEIMNSNSELDFKNDLPNSTSSPNLNNIFNKGYSTAIDIYAFGIVALEMAVLGIKNNFHIINKSNNQSIQQLDVFDIQNHSIKNLDFATRDSIEKAIDFLDNDLQKDFIKKCLNIDPCSRPTAKELLFHPIIFEVPSLKLICANKILNSNSTSYHHELVQEEFSRIMKNSQKIIAEVKSIKKHNVVCRICDVVKLNTEYIEKFFEEVRNGAYPLYAFSLINKNKTSKLLKSKRNSVKYNDYNDHNQSLNKLNLDEHLNSYKTQINDQTNSFLLNKSLNINENFNLIKKLTYDENKIKDDHFISTIDQDDQIEYDDEDQEDCNGSQTEDYENKCENCSNQNLYDEETRRIEKIEISVRLTSSHSYATGCNSFNQVIKNDHNCCLEVPELIILIKFDDKTNRKLSCRLPNEPSITLAEELIFYGFINLADKDLVSEHIDAAIQNQNCLSSISTATFNEIDACNKPLACYSTNVNSTSLEFTSTTSFTTANMSSSKLKIGPSIEQQNFQFWS